MKKRFAVLLLVLFVLALPLTVALGQDRSDTIIFRSIGNVATLNPLLSSDGGSFGAQFLLWSRPFMVDRFTGLPTPGLTTWTISDDSLVYTFTIRDDAVWSDGTPLTAKDAKFSFDAVASNNVQSSFKSNIQGIAAVNVIDDKTYEVVLKEPNCAIFTDLAPIRPMPAHRFKPDFSDVMDNPINTFADISSGPYVLDELMVDEFQRFRANPDFWGGEPPIKNLIIKIIPDPAITNQALLSGEIDYANMESNQFEQLGSLDNLNYKAVGQYFVGTMHLNYADPKKPQNAYDENGNLVEQTPHPIFSDKRIRQAVAMGYDKQAILDSMGENAGVLLSSLIVPALEWAYDPSIKPWPYDPEAAAKLLDEAGWVLNESTGIREKDGVPLTFDISYSPLYKFFETTALVAQDQLGQLGMSVTLSSYEWAAYLSEILLAQNFDATTLFWGAFNPPDPSGLDFMLLSTADEPGLGYNVQSYVNLELDQLMQDARTVPGCKPEDRAPIYSQIQRIERDDVAIDVTISHYSYHVMNKRIQNFNPGPWWYQFDGVMEYTIAR